MDLITLRRLVNQHTMDELDNWREFGRCKEVYGYLCETNKALCDLHDNAAGKYPCNYLLPCQGCNAMDIAGDEEDTLMWDY